jgi:hypothetical protein
MTIDRTHNLNHQTRYELRGDIGPACALTFTAEPGEPTTWKILLPGPGGSEDLYGARQTPEPDATWLQSWLTPIIAADQAAELTPIIGADQAAELTPIIAADQAAELTPIIAADQAAELTPIIAADQAAELAAAVDAAPPNAAAWRHRNGNGD